MLARLVSSLAVLLTLTLTCLVPAAPALGQGFGGRGGGWGQDNIFDPAVSTQQMERYSEILGFTADQQAAALALLEAYHVEFDSAARPVRDKIENLRTEARETRDRACRRAASSKSRRRRWKRPSSPMCKRC